MKLRELEIGSRVQDPLQGLMFLVAAQSHPGYGGTTLMAEKLVELGCLDAAEPAAQKDAWHQSLLYGSNDYGTSNLHRWLNAQGTDWYQPTHSTDAPPRTDNTRYGEVGYETRKGFLDWLSPQSREALLEVDIPCLCRTDRRDQGELRTVRGRVFLPSRTELGKGDEHGVAEGTIFPLSYDPTSYKTTLTDDMLIKYGRSINPARPSAAYDAPQIYDPKYGWWYWLRTANMGYDFLTRVASAYGALSYTYANNDSVGIRPVMNLDGEVEVVSNGKFAEVFRIADR